VNYLTWKEDVAKVLNQIRPSLQADGGDVELISVEDDGIVKVALQGHCRGCPYSQMTIKNGIEQVLKERIAEVKEVINV
jgi:Fe-S cluster biogenesis protein NfuA